MGFRVTCPAFPKLPNSADTTERAKTGTVNFEMMKYANKLHSFKEIAFALCCLPLSQLLSYGQVVPNFLLPP